MKEQVKTFEQQLLFIDDEKVREFTIKALEILPDYFWTIPASSTGKYHPSSSLGEGGLVRHTKSALKIAEELFRFITLGDYTPIQQDYIRSAIMLHDGCKHGLKGSKYTVHEHPLVVTQLIRDNEEVYGILEPKVVEAILKGIETHMSSWNTNSRSSVELPLPEKPYQIFIALCDYLSAQKIFNIEVDGWKVPNKFNETDLAFIKTCADLYVPDNIDDCNEFEKFMRKLEGGNYNAV